MPVAPSIAGHGQHDGVLLLQASARPDPAAPEFPHLTRHYGSVKGAWPRIVEAHEGRIEAAPSPLGGLCLRVELPALG